ncbi:MAG: hypothetical protein DDT42_02161 [candidate division WS2 bacterium]|uniref:Outer membrane protein beta-barrel domain-containing protein n=1 Tax=Psychracetigena formicireducens TaxID=2986056 RepID=A0A9E2F276_PSYF1|nr:hypothetical protein [Candidatus Psychracetigena formicireducens]
MKNLYLLHYCLLLSFLLPLWQVNAQSKLAKSPFRAKLIVGANGSQLDGDGLSGFNQPGLLLGAGMAIQLNEKWSFEPEMLFSQLGSRSSNREQVQTMLLQRIRVNTIELPVMFNYNVNGQLVLSAGLSPNVITLARVDAGNNIGYENETSRFRTVFGNAIVSMEYNVTPTFALNLRYSYGVSSMIDGSNEDFLRRTFAGYRVGLLNNTIGFSIRYLFKGSVEN